MKTSKQVEKHVKGIANHRRIDILLLVSESSGIALDEIAKTLGCNFKTVSGHALKLVSAGLLDKKYSGPRVLHALSPYGKIFVKFIKDFKKL
ncbi:MAG: winged helix-turn-helix domain-containing protein [Candidatus Staskawiczbacteria bacterium]|nr:winged helix-turn-helix domain-containing protein [Candidatus Staskawiczbacteria bacterium]